MSQIPATPLADLHRRLHAETQAYDTVEIVSTYGEPQAEYAAVRKAVGMIDLPHRGLLELTGRDRHAFLNNLVTQSLVDKSTGHAIAAGTTRYAMLLNLKGRVVLDLNVLELGDRTLLEIDGRLAAMLAGLFDRYLFAEQVKVRSLVGEVSEIALHGPGLAGVLADEVPGDAAAAQDCGTTHVGGVAVTYWRDEPCGVPGLHLIVARDRAESLWQHLLTRHGGEIAPGKRLLRPVGWAAFNATRVEAGRPLFGIDFELAPPSLPGKKADLEQAEAISSERPIGVLPAETGLLDRAVSFTKGCYLGQEVVARMHARGQVARKLVGLRMDDDALPVAGSQVFDGQQAVVGVVTSSTMSPVLSDAAVALALVRKPHFDPGTVVRVPAEGAVRTAHVVPLPFLVPSPGTPGEG